MRKYKQVKRKEVAFSMEEWAEVERRAAAAGLKTGTYIKKIAANGQLVYYNMDAVAPLINAIHETKYAQYSHKAAGEISPPIHC